MSPSLPAKRYTEEDIERGLQTFAALGNKAPDECGISIHTLKDWAYKTHRDKYQLLRDQRQGEEQRELAVLHADSARLALEKQREAIERIDLEIIKRQPAVLAQTAANLGKAADQATKNMQVLRDRPTQIVGQVKTADELDEAFKQRFGARWDVESTAEEIESAA